MSASDLTRPAEHGGDLDRASAHFGNPKEGWLDLSSGINPHGYPVAEIPGEIWQTLPSARAQAHLCEVAKAAYGVPQKAALIAAPGAQSIISLLPRLVEPRRRVAVVSPTYSEHSRSWAIAGHEVREVPNLPAAGDLHVAIVCNPDTPTGRLFDNNELLALADDLGVRGGTLIVDESYVDAQPTNSLAQDAPHPALIVIRSFGKFYGLPGVRLGFAFGARRLMAKLEAALGPWPVSGPAIAIGSTALGDKEWTKNMRHQVIDEAHRLDGLLILHGLKVMGGTPLFRLASISNARHVHEGLARLGIWTRAYSFAPQWLRVGLPGSDAELARLDRAMSALANLSPSQT